MTDLQHVPNPDKCPFHMMSEEDQVALIRATCRGQSIQFLTPHGDWTSLDPDREKSATPQFLSAGDIWPAHIWPAKVYRTTPKKLDLPWEYIDPEYNWAAMDKNGAVWLYKHKPKHDPVPRLARWVNAEAAGAAKITFLIIDTDGIHWETSLTQRPASEGNTNA